MTRSRAALLPFPGDPFLLNYWLKFYKEVWSPEVDRLYVLHNSSVQTDVKKYIEKIVMKAPNAVCKYVNVQTEHGACIKMLLEMCAEKHIMLIEDDAFIFKEGQVGKCFKKVEGDYCDAVAGKRGSCSDEILSVAKERWNIDYEGEGDQGPNFWPCYFFSDKKILLDTDRWFGAKGWNKGDYLEPLDHTVISEKIAGDTMVWTSLQLRAKGYRFHYENHYHGSPDDIDHFNKKYNLWDGNAAWTHIGSLSSGVGGVLTDSEGRSLSKKHVIDGPYSQLERNRPKTKQEIQEWERRVQWWLTAWENRDPDEIQEFAAEYKEALDKVISTYGLNITKIRKRQYVYKQIGL